LTAGYDLVKMRGMTIKQRSMSNGQSFSLGGGPGQEEDQWSGNPIRPVHWWHWA
jgi:hypothetical protein